MISSSRTSHRASTKARTDVSLFCISKITTKSCSKYFGANRKDVINLTTTTTKKNKDMKEAFTCFLPPAMQRENLKVTHEKRSRKKNREADISSFE